MQKFGVKSKDRVLVYLPMIPEAIFTMLACAKIGAVLYLKKYNFYFQNFFSII
jgi:acyl-coenzyme A synthetase/AMP-(fatty) acid ligase